MADKTTFNQGDAVTVLSHGKPYRLTKIVRPYPDGDGWVTGREYADRGDDASSTWWKLDGRNDNQRDYLRIVHTTPEHRRHFALRELRKAIAMHIGSGEVDEDTMIEIGKLLGLSVQTEG